MCTVYCVHPNDNLLWARYVVIETILALTFVEIVLAHRSKVFLTCGMDESHNIKFLNEQMLDASC